MLEYINAAIFGIVQGITEFLPISSSGHLIILHNFLNLPIQNEMAFDVILHLATLLAVVYFFRLEICQLAAAWFKSLSGQNDDNSRIAWLIIIGTIPAALAGWLFEDIVENFLRSPLIVAIMLIVVGVLFIVFEKIFRSSQSYKYLNLKKVLIIGFAQALALIPGTSRSGITILAGLGVGIKREDAIKFSFLLSIPIILGASLKQLPEAYKYFFQSASDLAILIIAFVFSFIAGFLAIKYFLKYARSHSLNVFAIYRFILAVAVIVFFVF
ncbi:MAG: undecaprenyl-diphosphatase UppP [Patescibacteria group bacterium]|nr:undecaprenyl-diphosphatase UppP [Patescibacteria group bacterium]